MAKVPERGLTDQLSDNVRQMMLSLNQQHGNRAHECSLRLAVMGGIWVMPGGEAAGGGDIILSEGAHREFTVYEPRELRFDNFVDKLCEKATQRNTVEVFMQLNHAGADARFVRQWMLMLQVEVQAGRRNSLRGIYVRLFDRQGNDLWEGRLH